MAHKNVTHEDLRSIRRFVNEKFAQMNLSQVGLTNVIRHEIPILKDPNPWREKSYKSIPEIKRLLHNEVDNLIDKGYIIRSSSDSNWISQARMIKNKSGDWIFHVDYNRLNACFNEWIYPIHSQWDLLERLNNARIISSIKIKEVFYQIELHPESRKYTSFEVNGRGVYEWVRMPYGLKGASASVCYVDDRTRETISERIKSLYPNIPVDDKIFVCLETWIVISETPEEHKILLDCLLDVFYENGLEIDTEKSQFAKESIDYLGFTIDYNGLRISRESIQPIIDYPQPQNIQQVVRFNGMVNHWRNYLQDIEIVQRPLKKFHAPKAEWIWTEEEEAAFQKTKQLLLSASSL